MHRFTIIASFLLLFTMPVSSIRKCKPNTYVAADKQSCIDCPTCGAGYEYNNSYKRQEDISRGFLDCFPCTPCPEGKYRDNERSQDKCVYCPSSCRLINRYDHTPCKGNTRGTCGSCFHGHEPETLEPNSICVKNQKKLSQADLKVVEPQAISTVSPATGELNASPNITMIVSISTSAFAILILIVVILMKKRFPNLCAEHGHRMHGMNQAAYASVEMQLLETGTSIANSTEGTEIDGQDQPEMNSRHNVLTPEQYFKSEIVNEDIAGKQHKTIAERHYPEIPLYMKNHLLCIISKKVTGEKRFSFFESLGLETCDWEPDNELWLRGCQSYSDYIFEVLKKWIGIAGKDATIAKLFSALEEAQFNDIVEDLLKSPDFNTFVNNSENGDHIKSDSDTNAADDFEVADGD